MMMGSSGQPMSGVPYSNGPMPPIAGYPGPAMGSIPGGYPPGTAGPPPTGKQQNRSLLFDIMSDISSSMPFGGKKNDRLPPPMQPQQPVPPPPQMMAPPPMVYVQPDQDESEGDGRGCCSAGVLATIVGPALVAVTAGKLVTMAGYMPSEHATAQVNVPILSLILVGAWLLLYTLYCIIAALFCRGGKRKKPKYDVAQMYPSAYQQQPPYNSAYSQNPPFQQPAAPGYPVSQPMNMQPGGYQPNWNYGS